MLTDDRRDKTIPDSFPGAVVINIKKDENGNYLSPHYRRQQSEEFKYFYNRILSAINPQIMMWDKVKGLEPLSEIFSVTDEAFALVMLFNELHCWEETAQIRERNNWVKSKNEPKIKGQKKFTEPASGRKQGWDRSGIKLFHRVCKNVARRRSEATSRELEQIILAGYEKDIDGMYHQQNEVDDDSVESHYMDEWVSSVRDELVDKQTGS